MDQASLVAVRGFFLLSVMSHYRRESSPRYRHSSPRSSSYREGGPRPPPSYPTNRVPEERHHRELTPPRRPPTPSEPVAQRPRTGSGILAVATRTSTMQYRISASDTGCVIH